MGNALAAVRFRRDAPHLTSWDIPATGELEFTGGFGGGFTGGFTGGIGSEFGVERRDVVGHVYRDDYGVPHEDYGIPHEDYGVPHEEYGPPPALREEPVTEQCVS